MADILKSGRFDSREVRLIAVKDALDFKVEDNRHISSAMRARAYELMGVTIANDVVVDPAVAAVIQKLASETLGYAQIAGLQSFGNAVVDMYSRIQASPDAAQHLAAAKANVDAIANVANAVKSSEIAELQQVAQALLDKIAALNIDG